MKLAISANALTGRAQARPMATKKVSELVRADCGKEVTYEAGPNRKSGKLAAVTHTTSRTGLAIGQDAIPVSVDSEYQEIEIHD